MNGSPPERRGYRATPIATPANMMVSAAAGYRFGDYWRFGAVTMVVWFLVGVLLVPAVWSP